MKHTLNMFQQSIPTNTVEKGMIVVCHGAFFLVTGTKDVDNHAGLDDSNGKVRVATTRFITATDDAQMPKHWRDDWKIQGNSLARTTQIKEINGAPATVRSFGA